MPGVRSWCFIGGNIMSSMRSTDKTKGSELAVGLCDCSVFLSRLRLVAGVLHLTIDRDMGGGREEIKKPGHYSGLPDTSTSHYDIYTRTKYYNEKRITKRGFNRCRLGVGRCENERP